MTRPPPPLSDQALLDHIFAEMNRRMAAYPEAIPERHLEGLAQLPRGLRAMAATSHFDEDVAIGGLGWHFARWPDARLTAETVKGLRELDAEGLAHTLETGWHLARPYLADLEALEQSEDAFDEWYPPSTLAAKLAPLDADLRAVLTPANQGIYHLWLAYARRYPDRLS